MKKALGETQTLHAGCNKAEPKFLPRRRPPSWGLADPFLGAQDGQNLISWKWSLPLPTNPVWWGSMHAISSYHGNRPTNTYKQTHRQDRLQYTAPLSLARSVIIINNSHFMSPPIFALLHNAVQYYRTTKLAKKHKMHCVVINI